MIVKPFRGWRPRPDLASRIPSPPYDVLNSAEARRLAAGDPHTFLHVIKPEIDLDPDVGSYDDRVYAKARESFRRMIEDGWLVRDDKPSFYIYRLATEDHVQTGVVGVSAIDDYLEDRIKKHELTREDKETDRTRHMEALSANPGPVFMSHRPAAEIDAVVAEATTGPPEVDFTDPTGVRHALWVVNDERLRALIESAFRSLPATYIADGHHRAASAARVAAARRDGGDDHGAPYDFFLTVHFPSDQVRILDYNRVVRDLGGLEPPELVDRLRESGFTVRDGITEGRPDRAGDFGMYLDGAWYRLESPVEWADDPDPVRSLSVAILAERVLEPILGVGDIRTDPRIDFVGGSRGMGELERRVLDGDAAVAFAVYPTSIDAVMRVSDAGRVMPPKSTWFEPKLRSGMVIHTFDGATL
jgi:uncharacterized protein (DUF1015 family)